jgi:hypothetical protein
LERISTVGADFEHAAIEAHAWINIRHFKIEIVAECQLTAAAENTNRQGIEPLVAKHCGIINEGELGDVSAGGLGTPLFEVTHSGGRPSVFVASHPVGNAGGVTLSKFSSVSWAE